MKITAGPLRDLQVEREIVALLNAGTELERVMQAMRERGLGKIESMKMLRDHAGMRMQEAKRSVHLSSAWADSLEEDNRFHEQVEGALRRDDFVQTLVPAVKRPA